MAGRSNIPWVTSHGQLKPKNILDTNSHISSASPLLRFLIGYSCVALAHAHLVQLSFAAYNISDREGAPAFWGLGGPLVRQRQTQGPRPLEAFGSLPIWTELGLHCGQREPEELGEKRKDK